MLQNNVNGRRIQIINLSVITFECCNMLLPITIYTRPLIIDYFALILLNSANEQEIVLMSSETLFTITAVHIWHDQYCANTRSNTNLFFKYLNCWLQIFLDTIQFCSDIYFVYATSLNRKTNVFSNFTLPAMQALTFYMINYAVLINVSLFRN